MSSIQIYDHSEHCILIQNDGIGYLINKDSCTISSSGDTILVSWHDWQDANPVRYMSFQFSDVTEPATADTAALESAINAFLATGSGGGSASYLEWNGTLLGDINDDQNPPIVEVLSNSFSGTIVWEVAGFGVYTGTLAGAFSDVTTVFGTIGYADVTTETSFIFGLKTNDDIITVVTSKALGSGYISTTYPTSICIKTKL